jgi:histidyl-tRNA synthetase
MFKRISGTKDILPDEISRWQKVESDARAVFSLYNFTEIRPPLLEDAALFNRSLGTATEIVQKQMFLIQNQEETYCLRPEGTASVVRAYIENNLDRKGSLAKVYYIGPMFRKERPQKGRLRQFHHIGCEVIGGSSPELDAEMLALAHHLLTVFGVSGYRIKLNSLGCVEDRKKLSATLREKLLTRRSGLCGDCLIRLDTNVLRILDCKNPECRAIVDGLDARLTHLCPACLRHYDDLKGYLGVLSIPFEEAPRLVRGLDYYTRTIFEITHDGLGAQDAIGAGGRYDNLVEELGGPSLAAVGFAFGVERVLLVAGHGAGRPAAGNVFVVSLGDQARPESVRILGELRAAGISCDTDYQGRSLKGAMRCAHDHAARWAVIIGENELRSGTVMLKDLTSGEQREIPRAHLEAVLRAGVDAQGS